MSAPIIWDEKEAQRWNAGPLGAIGDQSSADVEVTALQSDMAVLARQDLSPAETELAVTMMLDQSRQWLERAKESTTPARDVADFKAFIATVAGAAKQKQLSEDIQLDAIEMVRRSERALGDAIRGGQAAGELTDRGNRNVYAGPNHRQSSETTLSKTGDYFAHPDERRDIYAMTDGVSEEEFDLAVAVAKDEGNLSRANVVRKVREVTSGAELQAEKWVQIEDFAGRGFTSAQIAKTVGMSEQWLRKQAADRGIAFPADKITGSRRIDPLKVIENIVASVEANGSALDLVTFEDVTPEQAKEWKDRLETGLRAIRNLRDTLKEIN